MEFKSAARHSVCVRLKQTFKGTRDGKKVKNVTFTLPVLYIDGQWLQSVMIRS